ncbi:MAG: hypothetical protein SVV80_10045, partial [Planctomycetota bacterium]|nr:hypothetical protein [Planctomycetota bacterium]
QLDRAEDVLKRIDRDRPDFRRFDNLHSYKINPTGTFSWQERRSAVAKWNPVDLVWWKLRKARRR